MSYASNALVRSARAAVSYNKSRTHEQLVIKRNRAGTEKSRYCQYHRYHHHGVVCSSAEGVEGGVMRVEEGRLKVSERLKVVALMAFAMCLCNADRVVMSVAVVPLAARYGWSSSFLGIVQVRTDLLADLPYNLIPFFLLFSDHYIFGRFTLCYVALVCFFLLVSFL